jgi:ABC-type sugar transport system ATPase subunit
MHALQMLDISKQFGNVQALKGITFNVAPKQIHALCGENGAGKSTLMKVLSGVYAHGTYSGKIIWNGTEARFKNLTQSENAGIAIIAQELALVPEMSIAENIFLGREICKNGILQKQKMLSDSNVLLKSLGLNVSAQTKVKDCGIGLQQMIEIAKALSKNARLLILDEPTAALTETESETLLQLLVSLCKNGLTAIIISHKLKEVLQVANQITILRDGETVGTFEANQMDEAQLIKHMVGRQLSDLYNKQNRKQGKLMLEVNELCTWGATNKKKVIISASLQVHSHQIIGLAGLMGAGRTELVEALFGAWKGKVTGNVFY